MTQKERSKLLPVIGIDDPIAAAWMRQVAVVINDLTEQIEVLGRRYRLLKMSLSQLDKKIEEV